jgi:hypothetical protein
MMVDENNHDKYEHIFEGKTSKNKKRKAKREKQFDDYYEFKSRGKVLRKEEEEEEEEEGYEEELDEERFGDEEYLNKRKEILRREFQKMNKKVKSS